MTWNEAREDWLNFCFYFTFDSSNLGAQIICPQNRYTDVKFATIVAIVLLEGFLFVMNRKVTKKLFIR